MEQRPNDKDLRENDDKTESLPPKNTIVILKNEEEEMNSININEEGSNDNMQSQGEEFNSSNMKKGKNEYCYGCKETTKSLLLSCNLCGIVQCKECIERESTGYSNQREKVKKGFYNCKKCTFEKGKVRRHDSNVNHENTTNDFLQKKHQITREDNEGVDDDNNEYDSSEDYDSFDSHDRKKKNAGSLKKKKPKVIPEKIYNQVEKNSVNNPECNVLKCISIDCKSLINTNTNNPKKKFFNSIEQLLYYIQFYYEEVDYSNINRKTNQNKNDYDGIISSIVHREKSKEEYATPYDFVLCINCLTSLGHNDTMTVKTSIEKLVQQVMFMIDKKKIEENIFESPLIESKLHQIITQFLIVQGFFSFQSDFMDCALKKIMSIKKTIFNNQTNSMRCLNNISLLPNKDEHEKHLKQIVINQENNKVLYKELDGLFKVYRNSSHELFTSFTLKNLDFDHMKKILTDSSAALAQSCDGVVQSDMSNLAFWKKSIEALIKTLKDSVANNFKEKKEEGERNESEMKEENIIKNFQASMEKLLPHFYETFKSDSVEDGKGDMKHCQGQTNGLIENNQKEYLFNNSNNVGVNSSVNQIPLNSLMQQQQIIQQLQQQQQLQAMMLQQSQINQPFSFNPLTFTQHLNSQQQQQTSPSITFNSQQSQPTQHQPQQIQQTQQQQQQQQPINNPLFSLTNFPLNPHQWNNTNNNNLFR